MESGESMTQETPDLSRVRLIPPVLLVLLPVMAGGAIMQGATGLLHTVVPMRMQISGLSSEAVGLVGSAYAAGFGAGCVVLPRIVRRFGATKTFFAAAVLGAVAIFSMIGAGSTPSWLLLRFLSGFAVAGTFTLPDSWVGELAPKGSHGRSFAVSSVLARVALVLAPLATHVFSARGAGLFLFCGLGVLMACLPIWAAPALRHRAHRPGRLDAVFADRQAPSFLGMLRRVPVSALGCTVCGLIGGPLLIFAPLLGQQTGFSDGSIGFLIATIYGGGFVLQYPLGLLSDRISKTRFLVVVASAWGAVAAALAGLHLVQEPFLLPLLLFLWGGFSGALYATCVAAACEQVEPEQVIPAMSTLLIFWSIGSALGPMAAAAAMGGGEVRHMFVLSAGAAFAYALGVWCVKDRGREAPDA